MKSLYTDFSLLQKLFPGNREDFLQALISEYEKNGFTVVNYLYFASAMKYRLFEHQENPVHAQYKKALVESDFFLTDGIALQVFAYFYRTFSWAK